MGNYYGSGTTSDGKRVALSSEQAEALWKSCDEKDKRLREDMPDTSTALSKMFDARSVLRKYGWSDGAYCPKDGSEFAVIEYGSTGIFSGFYNGDWPKGSIMVCDGFTHPNGCLWKALDDLTEGERLRFDECVEAEKVAMEREARAFGADI